jgi:hypothetical protein
VHETKRWMVEEEKVGRKKPGKRVVQRDGVPVKSK